MIWTPPLIRGRDFEPYSTLLRELEGVRQEVLEHLLNALRVGGDAAAEIGVDLHLERKTARFSLMAERPRHGFNEARKGDLLGLNRHSARLDLGQIEDVADEVKQVGSSA